MVKCLLFGFIYGIDTEREIERKKLEVKGKITPVKKREKQGAKSKIVDKTINTTNPDAGKLKEEVIKTIRGEGKFTT